ncbi:MAG: FAD-dependent oxidoreductase [Pseudonocardiaceae bacterium]
MGYQARWLEPKEVRSLEPDLAPDMIGSRVAYFPDEGWVDPARLVAALLSSARASGAQGSTRVFVASRSRRAGSACDRSRSTGFPCSDEAPPSRTSTSPSPTAA